MDGERRIYAPGCVAIAEVQNQATITGGVEIGRAPGLVTATLLAPASRLEMLGILHLTQEIYGANGER
jgi:formamidase